MQGRAKVWLEEKGIIFGEGLAKLFEHIDRLGSINQAAAEMGMSYRQAWGKIKRAQKGTGLVLVETKIGGKNGGGAALTEEGRRLVRVYRQMQQEVDCLISRFSC